MSSISDSRVHSLFANVNLASVDLLLDILGGFAIDGAANGNSGSKNFLAGARELSSERLRAQLLGDFDDLVHSDFTVVDDVLGLLSIASGFLEGFEDQRTSGVHDANFALLVLDLDLDFDLDSLPVFGGLLDIFTDLLGRHTNRRALGSKSGSWGDFATNDFHEDVMDCVWVKTGLGRHSILFLPIY